MKGPADARWGGATAPVVPGASGIAQVRDLVFGMARAGGVIIGTARRTDAGWRIAECRLHVLWNRGTPLHEDPLVKRPDIVAAMKGLWANEKTRERGTVQEEILALHWKYTWSFDLNDPVLNTECFADDVEVSITLDQIVRHFGRHDWITANLAGRNRQMVTMHYVTNPVVTHMYNPDLAEIRTYVMTRRTAPGDPGPVMIAGGHYQAIAQRIDGAWKYVIFRFVRSHGAFE